MTTPSRLPQQLDSYDEWKRRLVAYVARLQPWLQKLGLYTAEAHRAIQRSLDLLGRDRITVAVVGEFSRGKTELINALFFPDYGFRLLPTDAGRTTMCPAEIFHDPKAPKPYLRLLPVETRLDDVSLADLRRTPSRWVEYDLDLTEPEHVAEVMRELTATRHVSPAEAVQLGLFHPRLAEEDLSGRLGIVEIPRWRHALINIPHPLLQRGLTILDTPGLNAVGHEPELTYQLLPAAQAILFILAADTGVTRSDLEMWQQCVRGPKRGDSGLLVVLNKTDTLWDELRTPLEIERTIARQRRDVARLLNLDVERIFPTSAQKGLLAHLTGDTVLAHRAGLPALEYALGARVLAAKHEIVRTEVAREVGDALETVRSILSAKLSSTRRQFAELAELEGQSESAISQLYRRAQRDKEAYEANVNILEQQSTTFREHTQQLVAALDPQRLEALFDTARREMTGAWTTHGLNDAMRTLIDDLRNTMRAVNDQTHEARKLLRALYRRFQVDHGVEVSLPTMFSLMKHQVELDLLHKEAEAFRRSPKTLLTEQHFVVRRYFRTIITRAREIFRNANDEVSRWLEIALEPLQHAMRNRREGLLRQVEDLREAGRSRSELKQRLAALAYDVRVLEHQGRVLDKVHRRLERICAAPAAPRAEEQDGAEPRPATA